MKSLFRFLPTGLLLLGSLLLSAPGADAQTPSPTRQLPVIRPSADTLPPPDSAANDMDILVDSLVADVDTGRVSAAAQARINQIVPRKATLRSVILPGWGQAYNGQVWKIPLVVAGFGTFGYIITDFTRRYNNFFNAYRAAAPQTTDPTTGVVTYKPIDENVLRTTTGTIIIDGVQRTYSLGQLSQGVAFWRRWRDYNIIFTALFYGLNIVDANVSAHLKTFDVSDSLTLRYAPTVIPATTLGLIPGVKLTLAFKK